MTVLSAPIGPIKAIAEPLDWSAITKYDDYIREAAEPVGWPVERVRGHIVIESRGDPHAVQRNATNGDSFGLLQVVPYGIGWEGWHELVKEKAGLSRGASRNQVNVALYDPRINIAVGVAILESFYVQHGTLDRASSAFFTGTPNWGGSDTVNGTTGRQYRDTLNALIREQQAFLPQDPIAVIMGGPNYNTFFGFNKLGGDPTFYDYGAGHGLDGDAHTGYDIQTKLGQVMYTPDAGTVTCVGTDRGPGSWQTGCGAFRDYFGKGAGRIEVMLDCGVSLILGHCSESLVTIGQRVKAGDPIAKAGGMVSLHVHLETRIWNWNNGTYWITDPYTTLVEALDGRVITPAPTYDERINIPQPAEFIDTLDYWTVEAVVDGVKVLQSTAPGAPEVGEPLKKGEVFHAPYITYGQDGRPWWITTLRSRISLAGTRQIGEPIFSCPDAEGGISQETVDELVDTLEAIRANTSKSEVALRNMITAVGSLGGQG